MPKQPEDHRQKATNFTFTDLNGKTHSIPPASKGIAKMTGRDLRDATLGGEAGQLGYMFKVLEAAGPTKAALDALYSMPQDKATDVMEAWGDHGDGDGASLGESSA